MLHKIIRKHHVKTKLVLLAVFCITISIPYLLNIGVCWPGSTQKISISDKLIGCEGSPLEDVCTWGVPKVLHTELYLKNERTDFCAVFFIRFRRSLGVFETRASVRKCCFHRENLDHLTHGFSSKFIR